MNRYRIRYKFRTGADVKHLHVVDADTIKQACGKVHEATQFAGEIEILDVTQSSASIDAAYVDATRATR